MTSYSLKIFRNSLLGLFGCLLSLNLIGQELPTVIPPSPEAAALFKSEEVPVSYYNGTTNYGIPIYTLQGNELSVPISINYNSSGIKVEEVSSWVGIGWSLNAGGTISRSIQGLPDEILKGYIFNEVFDENGIPIYTGCVYDNDRPPYAAMLANELDAKPDIFYFSYPGGSGKFVLDVHGKPVLLNREDILIEASFVEGEVFNQQWKITDKSGIQYMFGVFDGFSATESTGSNPFCTGSSSLPDPLSLISGNTSWYLRAMISADESDTIMFNYEPYSMKYDVHGGGYIDYRVFGNTNLGDKLINLCTKTEITHSSVRLKSIVSSKGSVEFVVNSEKRKDVESIGSNEDMFPKALSHIEIKDSFGNKVKKIVLEQSYLNASSDDYNTKRLQLDRIYTSNEAEDKDEQIFDFYYNTPPGGLYPSRLSNEQDYWGYYNGKGNGNLIPLVNYYNYYFGVTQELGDAIREVDFEYAKFCSLKKVNLPTGGNITFSYEPHSYFGTTSFVEYKSEEKIQGKVYVNTFADYPDPTSYD